MQKSTGWVIGGIAAALTGGVLLIRKLQKEVHAVINWELLFDGFKPKHLTTKTIDADLSYRIINRDEVPLTVTRIRLEVYDWQKRRVGIIARQTTFKVRPNGSDVITFPVLFDNQTLVNELSELLLKTDKAQKYPLEFIGYVYYKTATFGVEVRYPVATTINLTDYFPVLRSTVIP